MLASPSDIVELHPGWPSKRPHLIEAAQALERRGHIVAALGHYGCNASRPGWRNRSGCIRSPTRSRPRKISLSVPWFLLPETNSVKTQHAASATEGVPLQEVTFITQDACRRHFLSPAIANERVDPYWTFAFVELAAVAFLEVFHVIVQGLFGYDFAPPGVAAAQRKPQHRKLGWSTTLRRETHR